MKKRLFIPLLVLFFAVLACSMPGQTVVPTEDNSFLAFTQAAQTVEARLTQMAVTNTPTTAGILPTTAPEASATPEVQATQAPTLSVPATPTVVSCDSASFVADVSVPDGTTIDPNTAFTKTWRLKNSGSCTWTTSYSIVFDKGNQMGAVSPVAMPKNVAPGETVEISINMVAPTTPGSYTGYWKLRNSNGVLFGLGGEAKPFYVMIKAGTTNKTTVYNFVENYCSAVWSNGAASLPCPGTEGDGNGFVVRVNEPKMENGTTENEAALYLYPQNVNNGYIAGKFPVFKVESGDRFRGYIGCMYGASKCDVQFMLNYSIDGGAEQTFAQWREVYEGNILNVNLDLSPLAGKNVAFILRINSNGSTENDQAFWLQPRIMR